VKRAIVILALLSAGPALAKPAKRPTHATRKTSAPQVSERAPSPKSTTHTDTPSNSNSNTDTDTPSNTTTPPTKIKTKAYTFGAMDVEGKLKTPQLLYFLNRVKLELDMSAPDKRSFMKELERSADDKNL
jgi:hypothetical protein